MRARSAQDVRPTLFSQQLLSLGQQRGGLLGLNPAAPDEPAGRSMSMPAPVVAMLASITEQLFSLLPAVEANPAATAITLRITGSTRARYLAAGGYVSTSAHASSPRPASR
jgi:hypothetical protein